MQAESAKLLMELLPNLPPQVASDSAHEGVKHLALSKDHQTRREVAKGMANLS